MRARTLLLFFALGLRTGPDALSEERAEDAVIRVEMQLISVPLALALPLIPELQDGRTADAGYALLQKMLLEDKAELMGWALVPASSGETANTEEVRFPTEFLPPEMPTIFNYGPPVRPRWGAVEPTGFDVHDANFHAKVAAEHTGDEGPIALNFDVTFVELLPLHSWHTQPSDLGVAGVIQQPGFLTRRTKTTVLLHGSKPALLSLTIVKAEPRAEFLIARNYLAQGRTKSTP